MRKKFLSWLLMLCMVLSLLPGTAVAVEVASGTCGDKVAWSLDDTGTLTISGTGAMEDFTTGSAPWYSSASNVRTVIVNDGVSNIGAAAFQNCINLNRITIPSRILSIGSHAFCGCDSLTDITIPDSVISIGDVAFGDCGNLRTIVIPDSVTSVGDSAFQYCTNLANITISANVTSIKLGTFANCESLTSIIIPNKVISIEGSAFQGCRNLISITIPDNVSSVGTSAFAGCESLKSVIIPDSITSIENTAFAGCESLASITIPKNVTVIKGGVLEDCTNLNRIFIPNSVISIWGSAFYNCAKLSDIYYSGTIAQWKAITVGENNDPLTTAIIHCTDGDINGSDPGPSGTASITQLSPANGSTFNHADTTADTRMRIFFDREVSNAGGNRPELDFSVGTLEVHKADDQSVVYQVQNNTDVSLWNVEGKPTAIVLNGATTALDYGTEYYVTMPAGFIKFADSSGSPAINKGDWTFKTTGSSPAPIDYALTYALDGGSGSMPAECWSAGSKIVIPQTVPTKSGYTFDGWSDGTTTYQPGGTFTMPAHEVTLTAIWKKSGGPQEPEFSFSYSLDGGSGNIPAECDFYAPGKIITITTETPTKEGYAFNGWTDGNKTYQPGNSFTMPGHTVVLTAVWREIFGPSVPIFTVTYLLDGGVGEIPSEKHKLNETFLITIQKPTKGGYVFTGWTDGTATYQAGESFKMPNHDVSLTAIWTDDPAQWPINQSNVFVTQATTKTCTLASATMMMRRRAILDNFDDWQTITETNVRKVAWNGSGLKFGFDYLGMHVSSLGLISNGYTTLEKKKELFISKLESQQEGIVIYNHGRPHAVLLTDYDSKTDTFYCADPAINPSNRIPLEKCTIPGKTQNDVIKNIQQIWYIRENVSKKTIISTEIKSDCPVEMHVTISGETLRSNNVNGNISNNYATMNAMGVGQERKIDTIIKREYLQNPNFSVELFGTDKGNMTVSIIHLYADNTTEKHVFQNVPVNERLIGSVEGFYPQSTIMLSLADSNDKNNIQFWAADPDEETTEPSLDFDRTFDKAPTSSDNSKPHSSSSRYSSSISGTYTISVSNMTNGTVTVSPKSASKGNTVTITATPNSGYALDTLAATDKDGKDIKLTDKGNGTYTFIMPASKVTVTASFRLAGQPAQNPGTAFSDMPDDYWAKNAIEWASTNGYMNGKTSTAFDPEGTITRQQLWMILARLSGQSPSTMAEARTWAMSSGVSDGTNPGIAMTRQQMVTFLYRYCGLKGHTISGSGDLTGFPDNNTVANYAKDALAWAVGNNIVAGTNAGTLNPTGTATRAQFAVVLQRFHNQVADA